MPTSILLLLICPFLVLVTVFGMVVIVALCQAKPEDVPAVLKECSQVFRRLADRLPGPGRRSDALYDGEVKEDNALEDVCTEEAQ